jgi:hypothetical protein
MELREIEQYAITDEEQKEYLGAILGDETFMWTSNMVNGLKFMHKRHATTIAELITLTKGKKTMIIKITTSIEVQD